MESIKAIDHRLTPSTIFFNVGSEGNSEEILKLCKNGDIFVKGKLIENDIEVVDALREFLKTQQYLK